MGRKKSNKNETNIGKILISILILVILLVLVEYIDNNGKETKPTLSNTSYANLIDVPEYENEIIVKINDGKPYFTEEDYTLESFEKYSELDALGRCGVAYANICKETMPPEGDKRGDISSVRPTGWKQTKINGEYLYNRCHLIAYSLSDEDDNKQNLITGTRYFNVQGMLTIERLVLDYMNKNKDNHVLYRVTPLFKENNMLATGVEMEGYSVEDNGEGLSFNYFVYNVQPGANIDYATGKLISD